MQRAVLFVILIFALLATTGCSDEGRPGMSATTPTPEAQGALSPESRVTRGTAELVTPVAEELVIPTVSESELDASIPRGYHSEPWVAIEGSSITYMGNTNRAGYDALLQLARQGNTSELAIMSPGGPVYWGIRIGEVVYENGWDVRVRGVCYSSCANYIFPAGRNKIIENGGIVGWHGSARQEYILAKHRGISGRQQYVNSLAVSLLAVSDYLSQAEFNRDIAKSVAENEALVQLESGFYERIGVDPDVSVYGHFPQRWAAVEGSGGWTFTLADMAKFGLDGVVYEGSDAYPSERARTLYGSVLIEVDDR